MVKFTSNKQGATFIYGSSSSLSVTLSLHLRSMEPSGQESSEKNQHQRVRFNQPGNKECKNDFAMHKRISFWIQGGS